MKHVRDRKRRAYERRKPYKESFVELRSYNLHANRRGDPIKFAQIRKGRKDLVAIILSGDHVRRR